MNFYQYGQYAAFEKIGINLAQSWQALKPATQGLAKRLGAGGAVGAAGGAIAGGEDNRLMGALAGGALGAGGLAGVGHLAQRGVRGQAAKVIKQTADLGGKQGKSSLLRREMHKMITPQVQDASRMVFPRFTEKAKSGLLDQIRANPAFK